MLKLACLILLFSAFSATAQQAALSIEALPSGVARLNGKDDASGIAYTRLFLTTAPPPAAPIAGSPPLPAVDLSLPTLTAQCTQAPNGKLRFELFVNFGNVSDPAFYPPWHETKDSLFPPQTEKIVLTLEFLGYTKVKPLKRQFEKASQPSGQLRYNSPGNRSSNMEEAAYYLQYLRALPTLHISGPGQTATFLTAPLLAQIHNEPLCHASGI
jgi:hypothetical protein